MQHSGKWVNDITAAGYTDAPAILENLQTMIKTVKP